MADLDSYNKVMMESMDIQMTALNYIDIALISSKIDNDKKIELIHAAMQYCVSAINSLTEYCQDLQLINLTESAAVI
jgi:hypothetical protein